MLSRALTIIFHGYLVLPLLGMFRFLWLIFVELSISRHGFQSDGLQDFLAA